MNDKVTSEVLEIAKNLNISDYAIAHFLNTLELCGYTISSASETAPQTAAAAEYARLNPMGGVARMFEVMASRIRAGEGFYDVLADYELQRVPNAEPQSEGRVAESQAPATSEPGDDGIAPILAPALPHSTDVDAWTPELAIAGLEAHLGTRQGDTCIGATCPSIRALIRLLQDQRASAAGAFPADGQNATALQTEAHHSSATARVDALENRHEGCSYTDAIKLARTLARELDAKRSHLKAQAAICAELEAERDRVVATHKALMQAVEQQAEAEVASVRLDYTTALAHSVLEADMLRKELGEAWGFVNVEKQRAEQMEAENAELKRDAEQLARYIVNHGQDLPDHACRLCVPEAPHLIEGFVCGYHKSLVIDRARSEEKKDG